jgi:ParB-like chromosome segregation protein Spo0J
VQLFLAAHAVIAETVDRVCKKDICTPYHAKIRKGEKVMQETKIENQVTSIPINRLTAHPGSPNRMRKRNFTRLVRNIERTGRYEPLVVRRLDGCFQIINGHYRGRALKQLGYQTVDAVVWDVDDAEADILLCSLNRLSGSDVLDKKLALLERINGRMDAREMAKLLPFTRSQIEKLKNVRVPSAPARVDGKSFAVPMVFFVSGEQQQIIAKALASTPAANTGTKAARNAAALTKMAECFIKNKTVLSS